MTNESQKYGQVFICFLFQWSSVLIVLWWYSGLYTRPVQSSEWFLKSIFWLGWRGRRSSQQVRYKYRGDVIPQRRKSTLSPTIKNIFSHCTLYYLTGIWYTRVKIFFSIKFFFLIFHQIFKKNYHYNELYLYKSNERCLPSYMKCIFYTGIKTIFLRPFQSQSKIS